MEDSRDDLERILDEALASYPGTEPLAGMEGRILERIRLAEVARRKAPAWHLLLTYALAVLAFVGLVTVLMRRDAPRPSTLTAKVSPAPGAPIRAPSLEERPARMSPVRRRRTTAAVKQRVFPTPAPLTQEEHLLQRLARTNPDEAAQAFDSLRQNAKPIEVSPIVIAPLASGDGQ
jgi:hypothetical protein